jgi:Mn-dependent DtxR family transcriptional regulator
MRLEREGFAERETKRKYTLTKKIPKKVLKAARAR